MFVVKNNRHMCCPNLALSHFHTRKWAGAAAGLTCAEGVQWVCKGPWHLILPPRLELPQNPELEDMLQGFFDGSLQNCTEFPFQDAGVSLSKQKIFGSQQRSV